MTYKDVAELQKVYNEFLKEILNHPIIGPKLLRAKMVVQFQYTNPDATVTINLKDPAPGGDLMAMCKWGESTVKPDVMFRQSAEFSNRFWQGKENVIAAMAKRQVTASGSIPKALQLIPVIRPSFRIYPKVLERLGMNHLIVGA